MTNLGILSGDVNLIIPKDIVNREYLSNIAYNHIYNKKEKTTPSWRSTDQFIKKRTTTDNTPSVYTTTAEKLATEARDEAQKEIAQITPARRPTLPAAKPAPTAARPVPTSARPAPAISAAKPASAASKAAAPAANPPK
jgi:hypothetical protein